MYYVMYIFNKLLFELEFLKKRFFFFVKKIISLLNLDVPHIF